MELRERLFELRKHILDKTMDEFGKRVGLSKQAISQVESGKSNLSDVAIKAICREYGVREEWLRTGSGDIFVKKTIEDELTDLAEKVMADTPDSFRRRFVTMLAKLTDDQWKLLSEMESMLLSSDAGPFRYVLEPCSIHGTVLAFQNNNQGCLMVRRDLD